MNPMNPMQRGDVAAALSKAINEGLETARQQFEALRSSLEGESRSTAGDKHETGRAMVQLEMEQAANRLARLEGMAREWARLGPEVERSIIGPGAVVWTPRGGFVIGTAWGSFEGPGALAWRAISSDAPLAMALKGSKAGETVDFRGQAWEVQGVG